MKELYICDTPYQVMSALNIAYHSKNNSEKIMLVENQFRSAENLVKRVEETKLFSRVFLLRIDETRLMPRGFNRYSRVMLGFLMPKLFMRRRLADYSGEAERLFAEKFDTVYASTPNRVVAMMMKLKSDAELVFFDDGTGSYSGNLLARVGGRLYHLFCKVFNVGSYICKPSKLLVNNVSMCKSEAVARDKIFPMPELDKGFIDFCGKIFGVNTEKRNSVYWLSQPSDSVPGADEARDKILSCLMPYRDKIIVRMHPRDNDVEYYRDFTVDYGHDMWELSVLSYKDKADSLILIAAYSSAQINPKILFDIEPVLIFVHHFHANTSQEEYYRVDSQIEDMRRAYRNPEKIYNPRTPEELSIILQKLIL